jgi:hypothetical protein
MPWPLFPQESPRCLIYKEAGSNDDDDDDDDDDGGGGDGDDDDNNNNNWYQYGNITKEAAIEITEIEHSCAY